MNNGMHRLKITQKEPSCRAVSVYLDGMKLDKIYGIDYHIDADSIPKAKIELAPGFELDADVFPDIVTSPNSFKNAVDIVRNKLIEDKQLYNALVASIKSACNDYDKSKALSEHIADRIIGKG